MTISDLRTKIITDSGYTSLFGSPKAYSDLDAKEQVNVTNAMEAYIIAHPEEFTSSQVDTAAKAQGAGGISIPTDYTVSDATSDFVSEVGNQAVAINNDINPFSEKNRKTVFVVAIIGIFLYVVGPKLIEEFFKSKAGKAAPTP